MLHVRLSWSNPLDNKYHLAVRTLGQTEEGHTVPAIYVTCELFSLKRKQAGGEDKSSMRHI